MRVPERAGVREWLALVVLMLPVLTVSISVSALGFAVPQLSADLAPTGEQLLWIVDVYPLALAAMLLTMGSLGDRVGRRKVLLIGTFGFTVVSAYAAFATSALELIVARAVVGIFGATLLPSTLSLLRNIFRDDGQRRLAIAVWSAGFAGGAAVGPIVGGWLIQHWWWGAIFLLPVPLNAVLLFAAPFLVPESRQSNAEGLDPISIVLSVAMMGPTAYGLKHGAAVGIDAGSVLPLAVGLICGFFFVRRQLALPEPLLDVRLFTNRVITTAALANFGSILVFVGVQFYLAQHLQLVLGLEPIVAGWWLLPGALGSMLMSVYVVSLARAVPRWALVGLGTATVALGTLAGTFLRVDSPVLFPVLIYLAIGLGSATAQALNTDALIAAAPPERAGAASGLSETAFELGTSLGVAILGSMLTTTYTRTLVIPDGVPQDAQYAVSQTLGAAEAVAATLPPEIGSALHSAAQQAFVHGENVASFFAGLALLAAALLIARSYRKAGLGRTA